MKLGNETDLAIPPALWAEIEAAADEQHRPAADVVREALEGYLEGRRWRRHSEGEQARALALGLSDDGPLTGEYREAIRGKIAQGLRSLREGKGTDGETFFAEMEAEFEELERQGRK